MKVNLNGSIVALATPFNADGSINFDQLGKLIDWHIDNKTDGLLILGTTGESSTMTHEEDDMICEYTMKRVDGRVPVVAGSGSNCTETMLEKSIKFAKYGVDALLTISPYYIKANDEGMYRHFATIADNVPVPSILYNVPGRTGCSISPEVVKRLSKHENIIAIKEASGDVGYATKIARYLTENFKMLCGNDDIILPLLSLGASGVISVWANIQPNEVHELVACYNRGNVAGARKIQFDNLDIINSLFMEVNPIPVKEAMNMMGLKAGSYRLPLYEMTPEHREALRKTLSKGGLI